VQDESRVAGLPYHIPTCEEVDRELHAVIAPDCVNGIPAHLVERHKDIIEKWGKGSISLQKKVFPSAKDISNWDLTHEAGNA
jgi:hypothetical protein